jgi:hypothetical protein
VPNFVDFPFNIIFFENVGGRVQLFWLKGLYFRVLEQDNRDPRAKDNT